jgi:hypothetical protein
MSSWVKCLTFVYQRLPCSLRIQSCLGPRFVRSPKPDCYRNHRRRLQEALGTRQGGTGPYIFQSEGDIHAHQKHPCSRRLLNSVPACC